MDVHCLLLRNRLFTPVPMTNKESDHYYMRWDNIKMDLKCNVEGCDVK